MSETEVSVDAQMLASVRHFFETECTVDLLRGLYDGRHVSVDALWNQIASMGLPGAMSAEDEGGLGFGLRDGVLLAQEAGRVLLPVPLSELMAVLPFLHSDLSDHSSALKDQLDDWQSGRSWLACATVLSADHWLVEYAHHDRVAFATAWSDSILTLGTFVPTLMSAGMDGSMPTARADRSVELLHVTRLQCTEERWKRLQAQRHLLRLAELLGVADRALEHAVAYASERVQFGRAIGSNQAIKHRLAEHWMMADNARLSIHHAAALYDNEDDVELAIQYAHILTIDAARSISRHAVQVFGAMGITWECDIHLFLKRTQYFCALLERDLPTEAVLEKIWAQA